MPKFQLDEDSVRIVIKGIRSPTRSNRMKVNMMCELTHIISGIKVTESKYIESETKSDIDKQRRILYKKLFSELTSKVERKLKDLSETF
jgi:hypothetical protein